MIFSRKKKEEDKCMSCRKDSSVKYNFCPHCGDSKMDEMEDAEDFGLLGRSDESELNPAADAGAFEKIISTMMQTAVKTLMNEMQNPQNKDAKPEIQNFPNGIRITLNQQDSMKQKKGKEKITSEQMQRLESLPRANAKTSVRRFSDKVIYELSAAGIASIDDIFISKLETGYEIKALGKSKVYVNTIPVNLPLIKYGLTENSILMEFASV